MYKQSSAPLITSLFKSRGMTKVWINGCSPLWIEQIFEKTKHKKSKFSGSAVIVQLASAQYTRSTSNISRFVKNIVQVSLTSCVWTSGRFQRIISVCVLLCAICRETVSVTLTNEAVITCARALFFAIFFNFFANFFLFFLQITLIMPPPLLFGYIKF